MEKASEISLKLCLRLTDPFRERKISGYNYQVATDKAITGSRDNDTPVQSQAERKYPLGIKASPPMRAVPGEPRKGVNPVELAGIQPLGDFPVFIMEMVDTKAGVSRTNRLYLVNYGSWTNRKQ